MRVIRLFVIMLTISMDGIAQTTGIVERNNKGIISFVKYPQQDKNEAVPENAAKFFIDVLNVKAEDSFKLQHSSNTKYGMRFERYTQFYQGIEVDGGFYSFRYKNGKMLAACGNYVSSMNINKTPSITEEDAKKIFAKYMKEKCSDIGDCQIQLVITEKPNSKEVLLAYKVFFETSPIYASEIGYIDAHTGELIYTLPASICYSALGTFYTFYNNDSTKTARTEYVGGDTGYILYDTTRGNGIHTYNETVYPTSEFSDTNNIWTESELGSCHMALDVHWTNQQVYDVFKNIYGHNSFNDANAAINAHIILGTNTGINYGNNIFYYGQGNYEIGPMASVDIIGHEFGHAILFHITHWQNFNNDRQALHEGFGDIWGLLFEHHITPNADIWKTGEDVVIGYECERDFAFPNNPNARVQIADTYNYGLYNSYDVHVKGGIASHWFHLLANGGSGTNMKGDNYTVCPVGLDLAEELFTYTVLNNSYLDNCSTFVQVRQAFIDAANDMNYPFLAMQVANAWYAVGVGTQPIQIETISGSPILCDSSSFTINNITSDLTVTWHFNNNTLADTLIRPNYPSSNQCSIYIRNGELIDDDLVANIYYGGNLVKTLHLGIMTGCSFHGTYEQEGGYYHYVNYPDIPETGFYANNVILVNQLCTVTLKSPNFKHMHINFSGNNVASKHWIDDETIGIIMSLNNNTTTTTVVGTDLKNGTTCNNFSFTIKAYRQSILPRNYNLGISTYDNFIEVSLLDSVRNDNESHLTNWTLDIVHAETGLIVYSQEVEKGIVRIYTSNWEPGLYIVRGKKDKRIATKKIIINKKIIIK